LQIGVKHAEWGHAAAKGRGGGWTEKVGVVVISVGHREMTQTYILSLHEVRPIIGLTSSKNNARLKTMALLPIDYTTVFHTAE